MKINKLDLLTKGWKASEIEHASKIIEEAEDKKDAKFKFIDVLLFTIMGSIMIANGFVSSMLLVPFIYATKIIFSIILAMIMGFIFSALLTFVIYDIERIHHKHETNLFIAFITSGVVNFYLILEFTARFGKTTGITLTENIFIIAGAYLIAFLIPHAIYRILGAKKNE